MLEQARSVLRLANHLPLLLLLVVVLRQQLVPTLATRIPRIAKKRGFGI
jgi:hypothetical protein